jgi:hypothetical protein
LALGIIVAALVFHQLFVSGLDADHAFNGGTAVMMVVVFPALGLSSLFAAVSVPSAVLLFVRASDRAKTAIGLYIIVTNVLVILVLGRFALLFLRVWLTL